MLQTFLYIALLPLFIVGIGIIIILAFFILLAPLIGLGSISMYLENKTKTEKIILSLSVAISFLAASLPYWDEFISTGIPPRHLLDIGLMFVIYTVIIFMLTRKVIEYLDRK